MKTTFLLLALCGSLCAQDKPKKDTAQILTEHLDGAKKTSGKQDELAADVQQLRIEQTNGKVIELLEEVEVIMDEASENLLDANTGGDTIAAQTEVIEKIFEAAKQKQQQGQGQGQSQGSQGMMEMMKRMMGEGAEGDEKKPGNKPGNKPGDGQQGASDTANTQNNGSDKGDKAEERRVPKASGANAIEFPEEFRQALDAYNRATNK
jgi:hypothetical protein